MTVRVHAACNPPTDDLTAPLNHGSYRPKPGAIGLAGPPRRAVARASAYARALASIASAEPMDETAALASIGGERFFPCVDLLAGNEHQPSSESARAL